MYRRLEGIMCVSNGAPSGFLWLQLVTWGNFPGLGFSAISLETTFYILGKI